MKIFVRTIGAGFLEARTNVPAKTEEGQRVSVVTRVFGSTGNELEKRLKVQFPHAKFDIAKLNLRSRD